MLVIPAIDIKNGNCVRLLQGDPDKETIYSDSPVSMAREFESMGAGLIHVVDLDGAFEGHPVNFDLVASVAGAVNIPIEIGGGIRNVDTVKRYLDAGVKRIILGSAILEKEFEEIIAAYPENIIAGIDARDSMVATKGWKNVTSVKATDVIGAVIKKGIKEIIYTDIATDGMLGGPNINAYTEILQAFPGLRLVASGGVSAADDLVKLRELEDQGLVGAIVGKAIYDGRIDLREVMSVLS